jgi:hypothetical protein
VVIFEEISNRICRLVLVHVLGERPVEVCPLLATIEILYPFDL